jgi:predicted transcriptional regulator
MSTISIRLPDSLHERIRELARRDNVSINQFITMAVAEKASTLHAAEYLTQRAERGSEQEFRRVLAKVPDVEPDPADAL